MLNFQSADSESDPHTSADRGTLRLPYYLDLYHGFLREGGRRRVQPWQRATVDDFLEDLEVILGGPRGDALFLGRHGNLSLVTRPLVDGKPSPSRSHAGHIPAPEPILRTLPEITAASIHLWMGWPPFVMIRHPKTP